MGLLKDLKKKDKVTRNVLMIIAESQRQYKEEICKAILGYYKDCINRESVRDFLNELCSKDEEYLEFFQRYSKLFEDGREGLYTLLEGSKKAKRVKVEEVQTSTTSTPESPKGFFFSSQLDNSYLSHTFDPSSLYAPQQCKVCGLRYSDELYTIHIDDHFRKSRALEEKESISREYFSTYESWIKSVERVVLNLRVDKVEKIVHRGSTVFCSICNGKIETVWDDEEDEFVLNDCVEIEGKKYVHKSCVV